MTTAPHFQQTAFLGRQTRLAPSAALALKVAVTLTKWSERRRTRIALADLDDHMLRDIGLDRRTALTEARRKFWQA
ncbi:hypothetical protein ATO8_02340 [Roseivivax marinus]|uniref:YjiS-like domain-containing protein n=1 Tax=Roseivivax marinus TaxID=1379903 RepID=W4HPT3_9RHOB|nr:DUF1127 domain-containing protein [Roseivivax marinus]ETW14709.1 hypothetical protein ATO8_02340 [Roseivivax marinus]UMA66058.1 DUF1127 domain-containing protein [Roseivivax marinus]SEL03786.1 Uncharacterized conserved protein YjiS, DUF1127 family [Roseivivax marinus]